MRVEVHNGIPHEVYTSIETPYLFLLEALGADEVEQGRNAVGATGNVFNSLLHENTPILRADQTVANVVRCRPVEWAGDTVYGQVPRWNEHRTDFINRKPSPAQVRACAERYTDDMLSRFSGKYIVGLGKTPLEYLSGRALSVRKYRGTSFESGKLKECTNCAGKGSVPGKPKKCKECGGSGKLKCAECGRKTKHAKRCARAPGISSGPERLLHSVGRGQEPCGLRTSNSERETQAVPPTADKLSPGDASGSPVSQYMVHPSRSLGSSDPTGELLAQSRQLEQPAQLQEVRRDLLECGDAHKRSLEGAALPKLSRLHEPFESCGSCSSGYVEGVRKDCSECLGSGQTPADPSNPFVSEKIKDGQIAFVTYHPAMLLREPAQWTVVARDFQRLASLDAELIAHENTSYLVYPDQLDPLTSEMLAAPRVSVDLETGGKDPRSGEILCVGATHKAGWGCVLHADDRRVVQLLAGSEVVGQNFVLYDWWWLHHHGHTIPEQTRVVDTRFLGKLLNPDTPNDIYYLASEFADPPLRGYWKTRQDYRDNLERVACMDVDATLRIVHGQFLALDDRGQRQLADSYVIPISRIAFDIRRQGLKVNTAQLDEATERIGLDLLELRSRLPDWGGTRSEGQHAKVHEYLYDRLKLPAKRNRDSGKPTADSDALEALLGDINANGKNVAHLTDDELHTATDFIRLMQSLRGKSKLHGYFKAYSLNRTGVLHPEANPVGTGTLRWTFQDPNCQQVPDCKCPERCYGSNPECRGARYVFVPDAPDWEIMCVDLKQAEVIGMLWCAEQWAILKKILFDGMDAHFALAQQILGRDPTKQERTDYKTTTFALLYGEMDKTTAYRLGVSLDEVRRAREMYFRMLPGVVDARSQFIRDAMGRGYVASPFSVRRYIRVERETGRAANQAANAPIQNIPPMVIGQKMLRLARELPKPARLWLQVHDEVGLTYPKELRTEVETCVREIFKMPVKEMPAPQLQQASGLVFPIDIEVGPNWGSVR